MPAQFDVTVTPEDLERERQVLRTELRRLHLQVPGRTDLTPLDEEAIERLIARAERRGPHQWLLHFDDAPPVESIVAAPRPQEQLGLPTPGDRYRYTPLFDTDHAILTVTSATAARVTADLRLPDGLIIPWRISPGDWRDRVAEGILQRLEPEPAPAPATSSDRSQRQDHDVAIPPGLKAWRGGGLVTLHSSRHGDVATCPVGLLTAVVEALSTADWTAPPSADHAQARAWAAIVGGSSLPEGATAAPLPEGSSLRSLEGVAALAQAENEHDLRRVAGDIARRVADEPGWTVESPGATGPGSITFDDDHSVALPVPDEPGSVAVAVRATTNHLRWQASWTACGRGTFFDRPDHPVKDDIAEVTCEACLKKAKGSGIYDELWRRSRAKAVQAPTGLTLDDPGATGPSTLWTTQRWVGIDSGDAPAVPGLTLQGDAVELVTRLLTTLRGLHRSGSLVEDYNMDFDSDEFWLEDAIKAWADAGYPGADGDA